MIAFSRDDLKESIRGSIRRIYEAQTIELDLYRNTLDCFSASLDALVQGVSLDEWMTQERVRQVQKTKQNAIGSLHEEIIGSIAEVDRIEVGGLVDIVSHEKKILAEIKNKHNTTKGNHKVAVYDDLVMGVERYPGYTGYYVEILPKGQNAYNTCFVPSDNKSSKRRASRKDIRKIDGRTFYALLTGVENAIDELYRELPSIAAEIIYEEFDKRIPSDLVTASQVFDLNFKKAYGS